ncbi:MAG: toll/interleukin-1 receptor domain-containing protein [Methylococcales bacterium]
MPDICIFYSEPDEDKVEALSSILEDFGWSTWWSKDIKSGRWGPEIEKNIKTARCVIPIWNTKAISNKSITYVEAEISRKLNRPMITLVSEDIEPPFPFSAEHITGNINEWDCSYDSEHIDTIIESIESVLGLAPKKWRGERPSMINLLGKQVKLPCFVKSLSSHETQLDPEAGLTVLSLFPEPDALLVSAYDMDLLDKASPEEIKKHKYMCEQLVNLDKRGAFILMDSGNYEKARKNDATWTHERFNSVLESVPYTYAFCFDNLNPSHNPAENAEDVISRIEGAYEDSLIPILHAPQDESGLRNHELLPDIFFEYASRKVSPFIAVPERELGEGICKKAETLIKIREKLNKIGHYQPIHVLGTGNPLSVLILAAAGADLFDGLEWCRTVADRETGFLFHHQQFDFFKTQSIEMARYEIVREAMIDSGTSLSFKMGLHNLDFFYEWMEELQSSIHSKNVSEMLNYRSSFSTRIFVDEIKKLMPGLF